MVDVDVPLTMNWLLVMTPISKTSPRIVIFNYIIEDYLLPSFQSRRDQISSIRGVEK